MDEDRIVTRAVDVTWGGEQRVLPVLPMKPADEWRQVLIKEMGDINDDNLDAAAAIALLGGRMIDVMLAYDRDGLLGSREWIEEHVTDDELADAFLEVYRRSFRLSRLQMEMLQAQRGPLPARSQNGRSLTGI